MKRENMKKIIKLRSLWKIDKRRGNYQLPNGERMKDYLIKLIDTQMEIDNLAIASDGNFYLSYQNSEGVLPEYVIMIPFRDNEICDFITQEDRVNNLVKEMLF